MTRVTLDGQSREIERLKEKLASVQSRDFNTCDINDLSSALLDRLCNMKIEKQDAISENELELEALERAWNEADSADDRVREVVGL